MDNNNENLFFLAKIKIKNHRSPIKTELHTKESMTIIQEEKKKWDVMEKGSFEVKKTDIRVLRDEGFLSVTVFSNKPRDFEQSESA